MKSVVDLDRRIDDLQEQKRRLLEDIQNKSEELVKKLREEVDIYEIDELHNIEFDISDWYYFGKDPVKCLKAKCRKLVELERKKLKILNNMLKTLDKL